MVEEITATLARVKDFFVIARNSAFSYKGRSTDVRQVGRDLGVRYAVEGSVRRVAQRVRITAQLVETDTGSHIWSNKIDGAVSDLFELQDRMAAEVASAIQPSIRRAEVERARLKRPDNLAAYDLVMRALHHLWAHNPSDNLEAITLLERALAMEPGYGLAAALAAWAHGQQVAYTWTTDLVGRARAGPEAHRDRVADGRRRPHRAHRARDRDDAARRQRRAMPSPSSTRRWRSIPTSPGAGCGAASASSISASPRKAS